MRDHDLEFTYERILAAHLRRNPPKVKDEPPEKRVYLECMHVKMNWNCRACCYRYERARRKRKRKEREP